MHACRGAAGIPSVMYWSTAVSHFAVKLHVVCCVCLGLKAPFGIHPLILQAPLLQVDENQIDT